MPRDRGSARDRGEGNVLLIGGKQEEANDLVYPTWSLLTHGSVVLIMLHECMNINFPRRA